MKKALKLTAVALACIALIIALLSVATAVRSRSLRNNFDIPGEKFELENGDRIHFLNTGSGDCMLIESGGRFAMVDSADDSNAHPPKKSTTGAYEDFVIAYIKKVAADGEGRVRLDWILGTHAHSDHISCFDEIILDPDITIGRAYLREYRDEIVNKTERETWDNLEVYTIVVEALKEREVERVSALPSEPWQWGNFTVQFFNTEYNFIPEMDENANSVVTKLTKNGLSALLTGDLNNLVPNNEKRLAKEIGGVDLLKVAHHGYPFSSTWSFLKATGPDISIVTNENTALSLSPFMVQKVYPNVWFRLVWAAKSPHFYTGDHNGVIATFTDDGEIFLTGNIHG